MSEGQFHMQKSAKVELNREAVTVNLPLALFHFRGVPD